MAIITVTSKADSGSGSLRQAINQAKEGDTIKFSSSLANQTISLDKSIGIPKSLTIDGGDAPNLTLSGSNKTNIFWFGVEGKDLTVKNLTFADSYFDKASGGAIWAKDNSNVRIENSVFKDNVSDGAAVHAQQGSNITVIDSEFDSNDGATISDKSYSAGAISLFAYGELTIKGSTFTNNQSLSGGAVRVTGSDVTIEDSVFLNNDSTAGANKGFVDVPGGGGALYLDGASIPADPRYYQGPLQGETEGGAVKITNSRFEGNRAAGEGGAIMFYGYDQDRIVIENSEIINNEVIENKQGKADGGGLWLMGDIDIKDTTIANNQSANDGGGLWYWGEEPANIEDTTISGNKAANDGGGIYNRLWASETNLTDVTIKNNSAGEEAGAIYIHNNEKVTTIAAKNSVFDKNTSGDKQQVNRELIDKGNNYQSPNSGDPVTADVTFGIPKNASSAEPKPQSALLNDSANSEENKDLKEVVLADNSDILQDSKKGSTGQVIEEQNKSANDKISDSDVAPKIITNQDSDKNPLPIQNSDVSQNSDGKVIEKQNESTNDNISDSDVAPKIITNQDSQQLTQNNELPLTADFGVNPNVEILDLRDVQSDSLIQAEFIVNRAAAYDNTFGFYTIDDESGRIDGLSPSDSGYAEAAIKQSIDLSKGIPGGELIAPFLISDGTAQEFLSENPNNFSQDTKVAYFAFLGANPDKKDHIKLLEQNTIGFEDLYGLGDRSFDDLTVEVKFSQKS
ncbi:MAG: right-handed parallel beta-helix repeat-containing protein [Mastigocoleus sp.]